MIKFTQITEKLKYPLKYRAELSTLHSVVLSHVVDHYKNFHANKNWGAYVINSISHYIISGEQIPHGCAPDSTIQSMDVVNNSTSESVIHAVYRAIKSPR